jgi:hypothetical protein
MANSNCLSDPERLNSTGDPMPEIAKAKESRGALRYGKA